MQRIFLLCLFISLCSGSEVQCSKFDCFELGEDNKCYTLKRSKHLFDYTLKSCPDGKLCDLESNFDSGLCQDNLPRRLPGEFCAKPEDCRSKQCDSAKCIGSDAGQPCSNDESCNHGLYCNAGICAAVKKVTENCQAKEKCDAGLVCNKATCVPILSVTEGGEADVSSACGTFFATGGHCVAGPRLKERPENADGPIACATDCKYRLGENENYLTSSCVCGMTHEGKKYCNPGIGEIKLNDVFLLNNL